MKFTEDSRDWSEIIPPELLKHSFCSQKMISIHELGKIMLNPGEPFVSKVSVSTNAKRIWNLVKSTVIHGCKASLESENWFKIVPTLTRYEIALIETISAHPAETTLQFGIPIFLFIIFFIKLSLFGGVTSYNYAMVDPVDQIEREIRREGGQFLGYKFVFQLIISCGICVCTDRLASQISRFKSRKIRTKFN